MPTCPGCQRRLTYAALSIHLHHCEGVWSGSPANDVRTARSMEDLERRIAVLERHLERRVTGADARPRAEADSQPE